MVYVKFNGINLDGSVASEVSQNDVTDGISIAWRSVPVQTIFIVLHDNTGTIVVEVQDPDGNWHDYADSELAITTTGEAYPVYFLSNNVNVRLRFDVLVGDTRVTAWTEQNR